MGAASAPVLSLMNAAPPPSPHLSAADARGFGHVDTWIFDLDNTLYPHEARVWPQVDERITAFIVRGRCD